MDRRYRRGSHRCAGCRGTRLNARVRRPDPVLRAALAIGLATGAYAVSYGVLAVAAGLSVAQTCAMSALVFTGASQFAVIGVLGAGGSAAAALAPALLLAARNGLYGLALAPVLRGGRLRRGVEAQLVIDESTAMARAQADPHGAHRAFLLTGLSVFVCWNAGSLAGALAGEGIGDPRALGLDAMFPAAFLALLWPQLRDRATRTAAGVGAAVAVALVPVAPAGLPILAAVLGVLPGLRALRAAAPTDDPADAA
ncbi:branched-chain amino acid ABC transporter permease [Conexibacter sp. W3-3-2]|nr:branched-chain amino acid ABC transporter permease [Conexibacter sp. W3-3-2]